SPHPYAQMHITASRIDRPKQGKYFFIPHWPHPALIPRDIKRGYKFENAAAFGMSSNIANEFKNGLCEKRFSAMNLKWFYKSPKDWHDFSEVDVLIAIRSFNLKTKDYAHKSNQRLYNAWHARVPAILDSGANYQSERKSDLDYIKVNSVEEMLEALKHLKNDKELRHRMIKNGIKRAQETSVERIIKLWTSFFKNKAIPAYEQWSKKAYIFQKLYVKRCWLLIKAEAMILYLRKMIGIYKKPRSRYGYFDQ
ncbi:MAG: hypothetical protein JSW18_02910, partial [Candidatus Omnitrophota bacterium]